MLIGITIYSPISGLMSLIGSLIGVLFACGIGINPK